jgi:8-oxo-dGTP pyrophosphatase MutT (NUDIX family)
MNAHSATVGAILTRDGRLLLGLRSPHLRSYPGVWDILGGHIELGETPEDTLRRELGEELGVRPTEFSHLTDLVIPGYGNCHVFRVTAWDGGEPSPTDHEHSEVRWFTPQEAASRPDLAADEYRALFRSLPGLPTDLDQFGQSANLQV